MSTTLRCAIIPRSWWNSDALDHRKRILRQPVGTDSTHARSDRRRGFGNRWRLRPVLGGQSFAGHALTDVATAGEVRGSSYSFSLSPTRFIVGSVVGAGSMDAELAWSASRGVTWRRGSFLGAATGLAALFLYLFITTSGLDNRIDPRTDPLWFSVQCGFVDAARRPWYSHSLCLAGCSSFADPLLLEFL